MSDALEIVHLFYRIAGPIALLLGAILVLELISSGFFTRVSSRHDKK